MYIYLSKCDKSFLLTPLSGETIGLPADREVPLECESVESSGLQHLDGLDDEVVARLLVRHQLRILFAVRRVRPASEAEQDLDLRVLGPGG